MVSAVKRVITIVVSFLFMDGNERRSGGAIRLGTGFVRAFGERSVMEGVSGWIVRSRR